MNCDLSFEWVHSPDLVDQPPSHPWNSFASCCAALTAPWLVGLDWHPGNRCWVDISNMFAYRWDSQVLLLRTICWKANHVSGSGQHPRPWSWRISRWAHRRYLLISFWVLWRRAIRSDRCSGHRCWMPGLAQICWASREWLETPMGLLTWSIVYPEYRWFSWLCLRSSSFPKTIGRQGETGLTSTTPAILSNASINEVPWPQGTDCQLVLSWTPAWEADCSQWTSVF